MLTGEAAVASYRRAVVDERARAAHPQAVRTKTCRGMDQPAANESGRAAGDREATEDLLAEAALRLLERDGVLAGLNLRAVADEAGMNRGLIYHYFGSRQALLRSALERVVSEGTPARDSFHELPFAERRRALFELMAANPRFARLQALLALDGDAEARVFPTLERAIAELRRDVERGELAKDADYLSLHVLTSATIIGYSLLRLTYARELGLDPAELDRRTSETFAAVLRSLAAKPKRARKR